MGFLPIIDLSENAARALVFALISDISFFFLLFVFMFVVYCLCCMICRNLLEITKSPSTIGTVR